MPEFATRIPRNRASLQSPALRVRTPNTTRMRLNTVRVFARTMLAVDRLVAGGSGSPPRSASRRAASCSVRPPSPAGGRAGSGRVASWTVTPAIVSGGADGR